MVPFIQQSYSMEGNLPFWVIFLPPAFMPFNKMYCLEKVQADFWLFFFLPPQTNTFPLLTLSTSSVLLYGDPFSSNANLFTLLPSAVVEVSYAGGKSLISALFLENESSNLATMGLGMGFRLWLIYFSDCW